MPSTEDRFSREALDWFVRLQAGTEDPAVARGFRAWLESDPRCGAAFEKVTAIWGAPELLLASKNVAKATGFSPAHKNSPRRSLARKATALGIAVIVALGVSKGPDLLLRMQADYITATGERQSITLPDGSQMALNTGSAVALDFSERERRVKILKGEAYFDVRTGMADPFRVVGDFGEVEVKGTAFSVRLGEDEDSVVLSRGSVHVARRAYPHEQRPLHPGETISVTSDAIEQPRQIDTEQSLAWLEGRISFHDQPFGQVLSDLRRYYPGTVFVANRAIEKISVSGNYKLDQPLKAIEALAIAAGASMTTLPGGIVILR